MPRRGAECGGAGQGVAHEGSDLKVVPKKRQEDGQEFKQEADQESGFDREAGPGWDELSLLLGREQAVLELGLASRPPVRLAWLPSRGRGLLATRDIPQVVVYTLCVHITDVLAGVAGRAGVGGGPGTGGGAGRGGPRLCRLRGPALPGLALPSLSATALSGVQRDPAQPRGVRGAGPAAGGARGGAAPPSPRPAARPSPPRHQPAAGRSLCITAGPYISIQSPVLLSAAGGGAAPGGSAGTHGVPAGRAAAGRPHPGRRFRLGDPSCLSRPRLQLLRGGRREWGVQSSLSSGGHA